MIVKCKDKLFSVVKAGPWTGLAPVQADEAKDPRQRWQGHKITLPLAKQILSFFEWSYETTRSETLVHTFYHADLGWRAVVLPQEGHQGMSVQLLPNHPRRVPTIIEHLGDGWDMMGTWHHHCAATAFQSGPDRDDELTKEGLHVTVGSLGQKEYSLHVRASFRGHITEVDPLDWFELDETLTALLPPSFQAKLIDHVLKQKPDPLDFPEWWKQNVIKVEKAWHHPSAVVVQQPAQSAKGIGYAGGYTGPGSYDQSKLPSHYQAPVGTGPYASQYRTTYNRPEFSKAIEDLCLGYQLDIREIQAMMQELNAEPYTSLIDHMVQYHIDMEDAIDLVEEVAANLAKRAAALPGVGDLLDPRTGLADEDLKSFYGMD